MLFFELAELLKLILDIKDVVTWLLGRFKWLFILIEFLTSLVKHVNTRRWNLLQLRLFFFKYEILTVFGVGCL